MKIVQIIFLTFLIQLIVPSNSKGQELKWTNFENLSDSIRKEARPLLIFIHTDWCKFCAMQKKNTFGNEKTIAELNEEFYVLSLNAESRQALKFLNRTYEYNSSGNQTGGHALAEYLGKENGQLTYPTTVFMTKNLVLFKRSVGFLDTKDLSVITEQLID